VININGEAWRIFLVSPNHPALQAPDGSVSFGCCDNILKSIFIDETID
jgi:hypothetical protein